MTNPKHLQAYEAFKASYGNQLRERREDAGISRDDLAQQAATLQSALRGNLDQSLDEERTLLAEEKGAFIAAVEAGVVIPSDSLKSALDATLTLQHDTEWVKRIAVKTGEHTSVRGKVAPEDIEAFRAHRQRLRDFFRKEDGTNFSQSELATMMVEHGTALKESSARQGLHALFSEHTPTPPNNGLSETMNTGLIAVLQHLGREEDKIDDFNAAFEDFRKACGWYPLHSESRNSRGKKH